MHTVALSSAHTCAIPFSNIYTDTGYSCIKDTYMLGYIMQQISVLTDTQSSKILCNTEIFYV